MSKETNNKVQEGTWVKVVGFEPGEEEVLRIVPDGQADPINNEVPVTSPLAVAIYGKKVGEKVRLQLPAGEAELTILEVGVG